jgi:aerobic C4-dicarboxylate transport protein
VSAGYSFNLDGTCIYLTLSAVFLAQAMGVDLSLAEQLGMLTVMLLSSKGTAGVTGGGFVMLATSVSALDVIPMAGVMLVFGIDRFMSECRAVVNSVGNAVAGLAVARWQREIDPRKVNAVMAGTAPGALAEEAGATGQSGESGVMEETNASRAVNAGDEPADFGSVSPVPERFAP